jgi:mannose-6-phosphate isomerase-like protein (cupin superfamily)
MRHLRVPKAQAFKVLTQTRALQAAAMVLQPGASTGPVENEHRRAEQWLFVISGSGRAVVGQRRVRLGPRSLLRIDKGEPHQVSNSGKTPLVTLNFYAPPAYTPAGKVRKAVQ